VDLKEDKIEIPELGLVEIIDSIFLDKLYVDRDYYKNETKKLRKLNRYLIENNRKKTRQK
tara:strand:- start:3830 stop:4009 length:180 start_codon:yes stop_codon:yes gene_type:complete